MMEIKGKIIEVLDIKSGTSKNGKEWKSLEFILESIEQFPKKICFNMFGNKIDEFQINKSTECTVYYDLKSREYNGKWFTNASVWKIVYDTTDEKESTPDDFWDKLDDDGIPPFLRLKQMKIIENYKVAFIDDNGDYSPLDHFIYLDNNATRIGEYSIPSLENNRNVLYNHNENFFVVQIEDLSNDESIVHWVYLLI